MIGTQTGNINVFQKESEIVYKTIEAELIPGFKSVINEDTKFEGGPFTVLLTEFEQGKGWEPAGGLPSGQEASAVTRAKRTSRSKPKLAVT